MTRALESKRIQKAFNDLVAKGVDASSAIAQAQASHVPLSRLALYYLSRESMNPSEIGQDNGTIISIAADLLRTFGLSREEQDPKNPADKAFWPFDLSKINTAPSWEAMREAYVHKISAWARITSTGNDRVEDVIRALAAGNTVVFGTTVDDQWMNYDGGIIGTSGPKIDGRHATMLCGWDTSGFFWDENSWDNSWGLDGFCKLSPDVVASNDSSDFLVIEGGWEQYLK